jgi:hypothetical protein
VLTVLCAIAGAIYGWSRRASERLHYMGCDAQRGRKPR